MRTVTTISGNVSYKTLWQINANIMFVCNNYGEVVAKVEELVPIELYFQNPHPQVKKKNLHQALLKTS